MQDDAILTATIHPGNCGEVLIWQNFQPTYQDAGLKNQDLGTDPAHPLK